MSGALYLVRCLGNGEDRPWITPLIGPGSGQLYLRGGRALQWLPEPTRHPAYTRLADHPQDRLLTRSRQWLGNWFGVTLRRPRVANLLAELATRIADQLPRWYSPLLPSKERLQREVWLGNPAFGGLGIVWAAAVAPWWNTTTQTETLPTGGGVNLVGNGALTWVADNGVAVVITGTPNYLSPQSNNVTLRYRTTSAVDTANHEVTATCDFLQSAVNITVSNRLRARCKSDGTDECYEMFANRNDTPSHARQNRRRQVSNNATLYQDTTSPGTTAVVCKEKADGSSITLTIGALVDTQTDTAVTANVQWGFSQNAATGATTTDARILANLVCADVVSTALNSAPVTGLTGLIGSSELCGPTMLVQ